MTNYLLLLFPLKSAHIDFTDICHANFTHQLMDLRRDVYGDAALAVDSCSSLCSIPCKPAIVKLQADHLPNSFSHTWKNPGMTIVTLHVDLFQDRTRIAASQAHDQQRRIKRHWLPWKPHVILPYHSSYLDEHSCTACYVSRVSTKFKRLAFEAWSLIRPSGYLTCKSKPNLPLQGNMSLGSTCGHTALRAQGAGIHVSKRAPHAPRAGHARRIATCCTLHLTVSGALSDRCCVMLQNHRHQRTGKLRSY